MRDTRDHKPQSDQRLKQAHRIGPARNSDDHSIAGGEHLMPGNGGGDSLQHAFIVDEGSRIHRTAGLLSRSRSPPAQLPRVEAGPEVPARLRRAAVPSTQRVVESRRDLPWQPRACSGCVSPHVFMRWACCIRSCSAAPQLGCTTSRSGQLNPEPFFEAFDCRPLTRASGLERYGAMNLCAFLIALLFAIRMAISFLVYGRWRLPWCSSRKRWCALMEVCLGLGQHQRARCVAGHPHCVDPRRLRGASTDCGRLRVLPHSRTPPQSRKATEAFLKALLATCDLMSGSMAFKLFASRAWCSESRGRRLNRALAG